MTVIVLLQAKRLSARDPQIRKKSPKEGQLSPPTREKTSLPLIKGEKETEELQGEREESEACTGAFRWHCRGEETKEGVLESKRENTRTSEQRDLSEKQGLITERGHRTEEREK